MDANPAASSAPEPQIVIDNLSVYFGAVQVLYGVSLALPARRVSVLMGKSGSGKSTLLRAINRLNEIQDGARTEGHVLLDGVDIYAAGTDLTALRKRVGMVMQRASMFDCSVFDNVAYGPRLHGERDADQLRALVERSLRRAALWDEVADRLDASALELSGGQQQRLCIARALAVDPQILLMDEPTAALDASAMQHVEQLIRELSRDFTIVMVTHDAQQAQRVGDFVARMADGRIV